MTATAITPRNSDDLSQLVREGKIAAKLVQPKRVKVATFVRNPAEARTPRHPLPPLRLGTRHSAEDFATIAANVAQVSPRGFRQPSGKAKNWRSTSLVQDTMIAAGQMEPPNPGRSKRGEKKATAYAEYLDRVRETQNDDKINPKYLSAHALARRLAAEQLREAA